MSEKSKRVPDGKVCDLVQNPCGVGEDREKESPDGTHDDPELCETEECRTWIYSHGRRFRSHVRINYARRSRGWGSCRVLVSEEMEEERDANVDDAENDDDVQNSISANGRHTSK